MTAAKKVPAKKAAAKKAAGGKRPACGPPRDDLPRTAKGYKSRARGPEDRITKRAATPENPKAAGKPSTYQPAFAEHALKLARLGATNVEIADFLGINVRTVTQWSVQHPDFGAALKEGKAAADDRVERSLYARAMGFEHDEVDIRVVNGEIVQTPIRKVYPPDTTAAIFWLKNRRPQDWRDKVDHEHGGPNGGPIRMELTDVERAARLAAILEAARARKAASGGEGGEGDAA